MNTLTQFLSSESTARLVTALLHTLWQGTLIAGILYVALRRTPAQRAETRYALAVLALAGIVLAGLVTWAWLDLDKRTPIPVVSSKAVTVTSTKMIQPSFIDAAPFQEPAKITSWTSWAAGVWFTGIGVMFLRTLFHLLGAGRLRREAKLTDDQTILNLVNHLRRLMNITQQVRVCVSEHLATPAVLGVLWPTILVPASMLSGIPADQLRAILAHELAHIRRYDYLVNLIQMFIEILFFFNPAVWWISRQIRIEREACCDQIAVSITGQTFAYIQTLADWVNRLRPLPVTLPAFADAAPPSKLLDRIKRLLAPSHRPAMRLSWYAMLLTLFVAAVLLLCLKQSIFTAVSILSPKERIAKIERIKQEYTEPEANINKPHEQTLTVSGTVQTSDHKPLPADLRLSGIIYRPKWSTLYSIHAKNEKFTDSHLPAGQIYFQTSGSNYADSLTGPIEGKSGSVLKDIKLVLEQGFPALIKITDPAGKPIPHVNFSGGYKIIPNSFWWSINRNADEKGLIRFQDTGRFPIGYTLTAPGFQKQTGELKLNPDHPSILILKPARPVTGTVFSKKTGKPISGAPVMVVADGNQVYSPEQTSLSVPVNTDGQGNFIFTTFQDNIDYSLYIQAPGYGPAQIDHVSAGRTGLKIGLDPQWIVRGKILTDPGKHGEYTGPKTLKSQKTFRVREYNAFQTQGKTIPVTIRDGVGFFETTDLWPGELILTANNREFTFKIDQPETEVVLDLREVPENLKTRDVVFHFEFPSDLLSPAGKLRVKYTLDHRQSWREKIIPIQRKDTVLPLPVPCEIYYDAIDPVGCWIKGGWYFQIPQDKAPFTLKIPVSAAGTIYGRVLDAQGNPAGKADINVVVVDKSPEMESPYLYLSPSPQVNELDGKFMLSPLPFGGTYAVIAGLPLQNSWTVSRQIHIDDARPISKIELKLPEGKEISGQVLYPNGTPAPNIELSLTVEFNFNNISHSTGGPRTRTDATGRFLFKHVNPDIPGKYAVNFSSQREYQPLKIKVKPGGWWPLTIQLLPGKTLTGVVVDKATGFPIPGVPVEASATDYDWTKPAASVEAQAPTDALGRFQFSNMADREYSLAPRIGAMANFTSPPTLARPGQKEPVILRIDIPEGSTLKPNTSVPNVTEK
jgi:beta-lactamase regulating signal transducer with metallopeptidase domain